MALRARHVGVKIMIAATVIGLLGFSLPVLADQPPRLAAALVPASAQMTVGSTATFKVDSIYTDQYGQVSHVSPATINWKPVGANVVSYSGVSVVLRATSAMAGNLSVDITYYGLSAHADAPLQILGASTPAPPPTPAPTVSPSPTPPNATPGPLSDADTARLGALVTIFRPAKPTNSAPVVSLPVLGCIEKNLGARFAEISKGQSQPAAAERKAAAGCFSGTDPVPAVLAPVNPDQIKQLPTADSITMNAPVKQSVAADGRTVVSFHLSGTAAPNASLYIYVFSDPLVLRTRTNGSGAWDYLLNTVLPSGSHEIYVVAEKDANNFVRTEAAAITVDAPPAPIAVTATSGGWIPPQLVLAAGGGLTGLIIIFIIVHAVRSHRRIKNMSQASAIVMPVSAPAAMIMPVQSEVAAAATVESIINTPVQLRGAPGGTVDPTYPHDPQS